MFPNIGHVASGDGVGNALHSGKQDLGPGRITEASACSSAQVGLSTKRDVRLDQPKVQGQQEYGVNFDEIFSPVVKMTTLCFMVVVVAADKLELILLDVKTVFFHGDLPYLHGTSSLST